MSKLCETSCVYKAVREIYDNKTGDISEKLFFECIDEALKYSKREISFALFNLKYLNEDIQTPVSWINNLMYIVNMSGDILRTSFIINILEISLDEKNHKLQTGITCPTFVQPSCREASK